MYKRNYTSFALTKKFVKNLSPSPQRWIYFLYIVVMYSRSKLHLRSGVELMKITLTRGTRLKMVENRWYREFYVIWIVITCKADKNIYHYNLGERKTLTVLISQHCTSLLHSVFLIIFNIIFIE